jgi:hypothetical protein
VSDQTIDRTDLPAWWPDPGPRTEGPENQLELQALLAALVRPYGLHRCHIAKSTHTRPLGADQPEPAL